MTNMYPKKKVHFYPDQNGNDMLQHLSDDQKRRYITDKEYKNIIKVRKENTIIDIETWLS